MNKTILLIKANIINSLGFNKIKANSTKTEKAKTIALGIVILYALAASFGSMFFLNFRVSTFLKEINALDQMLIMGFVSASFMAIFISIYKAAGYLYAFKDFDLLTSLPLKNSTVFMSKIFFLYISSLMLTLLIGLPTFIVYGVRSGKGIVFYCILVFLMLFMPLVPMVIGSGLSLLLGRISSRFKKSNAIILIGSFVLILIFMAVAALINTVSKEQVQGSVQFFEQLSKVYFPAKLFVKALVGTELFNMLGLAFVYTAVFIAFVLYFAMSFKKINAKMNESYGGTVYKMNALQVSSPLKALVLKEIKHYFSTYIYVLNTGFGVVIMTIFAVGVPLFGQKNIQTILNIPDITGYIVPFFMAFNLFCVGMTYTSAVSISLEGKNFWILRSLPIKEIEIMKSKIFLQMIITLPALLLDTTILAFGMHLAWQDYMGMLFLGLVFGVFMALMGIVINLISPKMDWKSPVTVVKQSASALLASLFSFGIIALMIVPFVLMKPNFYSYSVLLTFILSILSGGVWLWIKTKGVKIFNHL